MGVVRPMTRRLQVGYRTPGELRAEFDRNLSKGGTFVASAGDLELREVVEIEILLEWSGQRRALEAEVVHVASGRGAAFQFLRPASEIRALLAGALEGEAERADALELDDPPQLHLEIGAPVPERSTPIGRIERRRHTRAQVRLPALLDGANARVEGVTRDLSESGALISADASELPPGKTIRLQLRNPETGDPVEVSGRVSRHVETPGTVAAVSVAFDVPPDRKPELVALVEAADKVHQQRVAAGISGRIEELGMSNLIQMLGRSSPQGTLAVRCGAEEGMLAFEAENLRYARLGATRGLKALVRMLQWAEGSFEFHAQVDALREEDEPIRIEIALLEAMRRIDEGARGAAVRLDPTERFQVDRSALAAAGGLAKIEEAVVDLATAGLTVRRILDVVPEDDAQVSAALASLVEQGVLRPLRG